MKANKRIRDLRRRIRNFFIPVPKIPTEVKIKQEVKLKTPAEELEELFRNYKPQDRKVK